MVPLWYESWSSEVFIQFKGLGSRSPSTAECHVVPFQVYIYAYATIAWLSHCHYFSCGFVTWGTLLISTFSMPAHAYKANSSVRSDHCCEVVQNNYSAHFPYSAHAGLIYFLVCRCNVTFLRIKVILIKKLLPRARFEPRTSRMLSQLNITIPWRPLWHWLVFPNWDS